MSEALDENNILETLLAFADGELDATATAAVLDYLVEHPQWLAVMRDHQRLRLKVHQAVLASTPALSDSFRARIAEMGKQSAAASEASPADASADTDPDASAASAPAALSIARERRTAWWPLAVAATVALFVGAIAAHYVVPRPTNVATVDPNAKAVPPTLIAAVTKVHVDCSRFGPSGHDGAFPTAEPMGALAADVRRQFKTQVPYPDLQSIGYAFVGAGPCNKPLEDTVHLLYRSTVKNRQETLSILVQPYRKQVDLPANQFTLATIADSPHPSYVWRTDVAVYYLVTDDPDSAGRARDLLQVASAR